MDTHTHTTTRAGRTRWTHTQQGPDGPDGHTHNNKGRMDQMDPHTTTRAGWTRWTHSKTRWICQKTRNQLVKQKDSDDIGPRRDWKVGKDGRGLHAQMDPHTTTRAGWTRWTHTTTRAGRTRWTHTHNNKGRTGQMDTHTTRAGRARWTHTQQQGPDGPDGHTHNNKGRTGQMDTHSKPRWICQKTRN